jgi:hypothetical protein
MTKQLGLDCYYTHQGSHHIKQHTAEQLITYANKYPEKLKNKKMILLSRNPLDVMVSSYFQTIHRCGIPMTMHDFIRDNRHGIEKFIKFNLYWREKHPTTVVTYESLHANTQSTLKQVMSIYGANCSNEAIEKVVNMYSFDNMRKMELESSGFEKVYKHTNKNEPEAFKSRRGVVGGYVNYLNSQDIEYCNNKLDQCNYYTRIKQ